MIIIGEMINASNKSVGEAIARRDGEFIQRLAQEQATAGADFLDVNTGMGYDGREKEEVAMQWLVRTVQSATDKPLVIDSDAANVIRAGISQYRGDKLIINSVTAETDRLEQVGRLAAKYQTGLVALAMESKGIPQTVEQRLKSCEIIMDILSKLGVKEEQVFFDPLVLPIAVDASQALVTLETLKQIKKYYPGARTVVGLSNISYGLPGRNLINHTFFMMAMSNGLDTVILDPLDAKLMSIIKVAEMLVNKDPNCRRYIRAYRRGEIR